MGPRRVPEIEIGVQADVPKGSIVYATASGSNVVDVDGNRYVDLAAGFGAALLGHRHPHIARVLELQAARLWQALGDVHPADAKIALSERLAALHPADHAQVILGQSGADAVSAALKTAALWSGKPGVLAFGGAYHGLSYGPLAVCGLRPSYREPFAAQLNPHVRLVDYPAAPADLDRVLGQARAALKEGTFGAVLVEPILGRGGCIVPPADFLPELSRLARAAGALFIADEIWTGLGRSGQMLCSASLGPDLVCLGKGLGGGLPVSACIGSAAIMSAWSRSEEVVHTSTFSGAPLPCATAIATLDTIARDGLVSRAATLGASFGERLRVALGGLSPALEVRGQGMMIGIDAGRIVGGAVRVQRALLERGYIVSTGGGSREVVVLTPPLTISEALLDGFVAEAEAALQALAS